MDRKSNIKGRRKERIRSLLEENTEVVATPPLFVIPEKSTSFKEWGTQPDPDRFPSEELDPEVVWKERRGGWEDQDDGGGSNFVSGFIRRVVASVLVFGAVWGVFAVQQPWAHKVQFFITDALSHEMDFAAARVWYEEHFDGAPAFIPMFGDKEEPAQKVAALHDLNPPVVGSIVQPFATTLKGVKIMPQSNPNGSVIVNSVDMGQVLSILKDQQGGIQITVRHTGGIIAEYGHLSGTKLKVNDWVQNGDAIGWLIETEGSSDPLLFFSVRKDKTYIDPTEVVSFD